jgi:hypothetical protein
MENKAKTGMESEQRGRRGERKKGWKIKLR